ncbi:MAG: hypothetical protein K8I00_05355 [Candidatus Omnitrophica bacterium]|nr:hypothetical protein [Candidatus Omnitrophota bacterium]
MNVLFALILMMTLGTPAAALEPVPQTVYRISELNGINPRFGTYEVWGYVVKVYECPPCPEGAQCKPCMADHIVIAERRSRFAEYVLTDREMIVFTDDNSDLHLNRKYRFLIQIMNVKTTDQILNNPKLIYYERTR